MEKACIWASETCSKNLPELLDGVCSDPVHGCEDLQGGVFVGTCLSLWSGRVLALDVMEERLWEAMNVQDDKTVWTCGDERSKEAMSGPVVVS